MFGESLLCGIKSVKVKTQDVQGRLVRRCVVVLVHELTAGIARELGAAAVVLRKHLRDNDLEKATLPIENVAALGALRAGGDAVEIGRLVGTKATLLKAGEHDAGPTVQFEFEFGWQEDAWAFLGRHCSAVADVVLTKRQLALALDPGGN